MRRKLVVVALLLAAVAGIGWFFLAGPGSRHVSRWCASQISAIVDAHVQPDFAFDSFSYRMPKTITLRGVRLVAGGESIVTVDSIEIVLARVPRRGEPIVIERVTLEKPVVRLIPTGTGSLLGFGDFVKPGEGAMLADGGSTRLSDVLAIDTIRLVRPDSRWPRGDRCRSLPPKNPARTHPSGCGRPRGSPPRNRAPSP